jgi:transcription initiation factor TFIIIB Brf1 subunit/transcription initiation factor TFIIB
MDKCAYCSSARLHKEHGYLVCAECASVNERVLAASAEWRTFGEAQDGSMHRVGAALDALVPSGLQMHVDLQGGCRSADAFRSKQMHAWGRSTSKERSLLKAYNQIAQCGKKHGLTTSVVNDAKALFRQQEKIQRGRRAATMATCVYNACKQNGVARSTLEVAAMFDLRDDKVIAKVSKQLDDDDATSTPLDFIARFSSAVRAPKEALELALLIGERVTDLDVAPSFVPPTVACACIAMACKATDAAVSFDALAHASNASPTAIARCFKTLCANVDRVVV